MKNKQLVLEQIIIYKERFPAEKELINEFVSFAQQTNENELYSRKNFNGHITASAFVVNEQWDSVLMIKHKFLNRWLQPGGHVDENDASVLAAAQREVEEETGIPSNTLIPVADYIFDIDSHRIPENIKKNEPSHTHHDARYLFICNHQNQLKLDSNEVTEYAWITFDELSKNTGFEKVAKKLIAAKSLYHTMAL